MKEETKIQTELIEKQNDNFCRFDAVVRRKPKDVIYLNLTNGLEALPLFADNYKIIRIQSTACEQKRWDFILADLDYNLLFDLALGDNCFIVDYTQRKETPRALFQGIEWIKFALYKIWLDKEYKAMVRGNDASRYFAEMYKTVNIKTLNRLKYLRKFINTTEINLIAVGEKTANDGNYGYYAELTKVYA